MVLEYDILKICQPTKLEDGEEKRKSTWYFKLFSERKYCLFPELGEEEGEFYLEFRVGDPFKDLLELSFHYGFIAEFEMLWVSNNFNIPESTYIQF